MSDGLIIIMNQQAEITIWITDVLKVALKARYYLFKGLLAYRCPNARRIEMHLVDTLSKEASKSPATYATGEICDESLSLREGEMNIRPGLLIVLTRLMILLRVP